MAAYINRNSAVAVFILAVIACNALESQQNQPDEAVHDLLDIETPTSFSYNSPLLQPDSLRSRPYFDFLSTLYRRDSTKSELFRPYLRGRRYAQPQPASAAVAINSVARRQRRAIVFRPLFVYKQQQVRRSAANRKRA